jgi:hypothetical protein
MKRRSILRRIFLSIAALGSLAATGAWWLRAGAELSADDPKLLANRVWAERSPQSERDLVLYFVPLQLGSKRSGVIQRASRYAYGGEVFAWQRDESVLVLEMSQRKQTFRIPARTWACGANEAPKGFDLCLELGAGDDKVRLFSRKGWRVPKGEDLPEVAATLSPEALPALDGACGTCTEAGLEVLLERLGAH